MSSEESTDPAGTETPSGSPEPAQAPVREKKPDGPRAYVVILASILFAGLALWGTSRRDFWRNENETALLLREMEGALQRSAKSLDLSGWVVPTLFEEPFLGRPPLFYWLSCAIRFASGLEPNISYRIPALIFALTSLWLTFRLGGRLFDRRVGFLAMAIQGTSCFFFLEATWLGPEFPFTVLCQLALTGFVLGTHAEGSTAWKVAGWLGLAGASMTVSLFGAIGLVFGTLLIYCFFGGGVQEVKERFRQICGAYLWLLFPAAAVPWYAYAAIEHGELLLEQHVVQGHLSQFTGTDFTSTWPLFHLFALLIGLLPWTIFLPVGIFHGKDRTSRPGQRLCIYWLFVPLIGLSLLPAKNASYLLFCWPPVALLIPAAFYETGEKYSVWEDYLGGGVARILPHLLKAPMVVVAALFLLWYFKVYEQRVDARVAEMLADASVVAPFLGVAAAGAAGALLASYRVRKLVHAGETATAVFESARATLFFLLTAGFAICLLNPVESPRLFLEEVQSRVGDRPLSTYGKTRPPEVSYGLRRIIRHFEELDPQADRGSPEDEPRRRLEEYLKRPDRAYLLTSAGALEGLDIQFPGLRSRLHPAGVRGPLGTREVFVLLSNLPAEE